MSLPADSQIRFIVQRASAIHDRLQQEIGTRPLVLPTGKFFPDTYRADQASVEALLRRMMMHGGMTDIPVEVRILGAEQESSTGCGCGHASSNEKCESKCGDNCRCSHDSHDSDASPRGTAKPQKTASACSGGGCGTGCGTTVPAGSSEPRLVDLGSSWRLQIPEPELSHAVALTTNLVRTLGVIFLAETHNSARPLEGSLEANAEIAATLLGFGGLLLSGSYIYSKGCGGPRVTRLTTLSPGDLAIATVLFAKAQKHDLRPLLRELSVTQKDALSKAQDWLDERPQIAELYVSAPTRLASGDIPMAAAKQGLWSRLFGNKTTTSIAANAAEPDLAELEAMLANASDNAKARTKRPRDEKSDELRALVDEALSGSKID